MASQHNELRRAQEITAAVKAIIGESDSESTLERFGETLTPVLNIWDRPEWAFLRREFRWATQPITSPAVAAQSSFVQLFNQTDTGRVVVIEKVFALVAVVRNLSYALTATTRGATGGFSAFDTDTRTNEGTVSLVDPVTCSFGSSAAFGSDVEIHRGAVNVAGLTADLLVPIVILVPGRGVCVSNPTQNEAITVHFHGYSRPVRRDEIG